MKVIDLAKICQNTSTEFEFKEGSKTIGKATAGQILLNYDKDAKDRIQNRVINSYRVENGYLEVYLKY